MVKEDIVEARDVNIDASAYLLPNEDGVFSSPRVKDGSPIRSFNGCDTPFAILLNSVKKYENNPFLGWHLSPDSPYEWSTYKEVWENVLACGSGLQHLDVFPEGSDKCVGIYATNCPEWLTTELACLGYGFVTVPVYNTIEPDALQHVLNQTELSIVFCGSPVIARKLITGKSQWPKLKYIIVFKPGDQLDELTSEAGNDIKILSYDYILKMGKDHPAPPKPLDRNGLAIICYTSGTTGVPKGVMTSNGAMASAIGSIHQVVDDQICDEKDSYLSYLPLAHSLGQCMEMTIMSGGGKIGYFSGSIKTLNADMKALQPTIFSTVPRVIQRISDNLNKLIGTSPIERATLDFAIKQKLKLVDSGNYGRNTVYDKMYFDDLRKEFGNRMRIVFVGSAPISPRLIQVAKAVFSCPFVIGYGATETCGTASTGLCRKDQEDHVGIPFPGTLIKLKDVPDMDFFVSRDGKGEVCVKNASLMKGYYKEPKLTAKAIDEEGWYHTGDVGMWKDGRLMIVDRCKHIFKLAQGEYIAPERVEMVYAQSPLVLQVFVDGNPNYNYPVALVVPDVAAVQKAIGALKVSAGDLKHHIAVSSEAKQAILASFKEIEQSSALKGYEKVKAIRLLEEPFTVENKMVTPTLKAARPVVRRVYAEQLKSLYNEI